MNPHHLHADWVLEQGSILNTTTDGEAAIALTLTEHGGGTLLSSTRYVHYGQITARCMHTPPFSPPHLTRMFQSKPAVGLVLSLHSSP